MKIKTLFVGNVIRHFAELSSTNAYAVEELAKTTPSEGTVISTDYQTAGRGQIGRSWHASPGLNVLISLILHPRWLAARQQFLLSQAMALGVADTISEFAAIAAQVKWPNDVYLGDQKLAGILIQNSLSGPHLQWSVVGIGLNVNENTFPAPITNASSLQLFLGKPLAPELVRGVLFQRLEQRYLQLKSRPKSIQVAYLQHLYRYQEWHTFQDTANGTRFTGQIIGVKESGKLAIQKETGDVQYFDLKEVAFI